MRQNEFVRIFGGVIVFLAILIGVFSFIQVLANSPLWSENGAAWVQAIGSVIAIFAAFFLGERQAAKARKDALDLVRIELQHKRRAIFELCRAAKLRSDLVRSVFVTEYDSAARYNRYHHDLIRGIVAGFESAPTYEIGSGAAVNAFVEIKIQCGLLIQSIDALDEDAGFRALSFYPTMGSNTPHVRQRNIATHCDRIDELFAIISQHMVIKE